MNEPTCIGCGCTEDEGCFDEQTGAGCSWVRVDCDGRAGVCSCCEGLVARWDAGDRNFTAAAMEAISIREGMAG